MVFLMSLSPLVVNSLPVSFRCEHRIAAPDRALPFPTVPFPPVTSDARDHRAADRSQARCSTRAPQSSGAGPHSGGHGCFHWHWHWFSSGTTFFYISSKLRTFMGLFIRSRQVPNAMFLVLLILLVRPNVQSMELRHLRYFAAVAAHGSFNRAANQLHLTQPALSRQVKSLEDEIGGGLIVRGQNIISLTSAGEDFYEEAKDILA